MVIYQPGLMSLDFSAYTPHGFCIAWNPVLIWADAISDGLIAAAYLSIPIALAVFLRRRRTLSFSWMFGLFGLFILLCGSTHVLAAITLWIPAYRLEAVLKVLTAGASVATAVALWPLIPRAVALPSATELQRQIDERDRIERSFRLLVDGVPNYGIFMLDREGFVTSWNRGAERIKGYAASEIIGRHFSCFYTAEDMAADMPRRSLETARTNGRFEAEGWRLRKDGSPFWANVAITAIHGRDGELLGFGKVIRDLTERVREQQVLREANEALEARVLERTESLTRLTEQLSTEIEERKIAETTLRETTELLEATFDAAPFPIIVTRGGRDVLMWNKAGEATFGFTQEELLGAGYERLVPADRTGEAQRVLNAARIGPLVTESQIPRKDGKLLDIRLSVAPVFRESGALRAIVTVMQDLTLQKLTEAQLRQSQKMEAIGTLTGGLAHDFNNLLGIIIGNIDLLRSIRSDDEQVNTLSGEALDAALKGAELTRSLLAFARRQPLQSKRLDLDFLISGSVRLLSRLLGEDIQVDVDFGREVCAVMADPAQLEAALTNLATNARDAMPRGGKLTIATGHRTIDADYAAASPEVPPGDYAVIEVTDTGTGMPSEILNRVFEPFFSTKNERGTGLGLSMVFGFLKQSGGHVSVYSEVGIGTTFRLYLPCSHEPEDAAVDLSPTGMLAGKGETILVVEDNIPLRRLVVRQLESLGYCVFEAGTGLEALDALKAQRIDLLFSDVAMPGGMDGLALAETAARLWPQVRVVLTSGFPQTRFNETFGASTPPLLSKPYRKDALARIVRETLDHELGVSKDTVS